MTRISFKPTDDVYYHKIYTMTLVEIDDFLRCSLRRHQSVTTQTISTAEILQECDFFLI